MTTETTHRLTDRPGGSWLLRTAVAGVLLLAAGAFVLSYSALHAVAVAAGINPNLAGLYPLIIDGFLTIASLAALHLRDHGSRVTWYPWALLGGFFTVSVWCNALHAASRDGQVALSGDTAALVSAMPPIALGLAIHLLIFMLRPTEPASQAAVGSSRPTAGCEAGASDVSETEREFRANGNVAARRKPRAATSNTTTRTVRRARTDRADGRHELRDRAATAISDARRTNTELTGAELGRLLGVSPRHGRRLLHTLELEVVGGARRRLD